MDAVTDALTGTRFLEGVFLLFVTAGLTGLLVPLIKAKVDDRAQRDQKVFESDLARQAKVIDAQAKLLEDLSQLLWALLMLTLAVTYYGAEGDDGRFDAAWARWQADSWEHFARIRAEISKARRLTPAETHRELQNVYDRWFGPLSLELARRARSGPGADWVEFHNRTYAENTVLVDDVLSRLADELRLSRPAAAISPPPGVSYSAARP